MDHAQEGHFQLCLFAADPVLVAVKAVRVGVGNVVPDGEVTVRNLAAVKIGRCRWHADVEGGGYIPSRSRVVSQQSK